MSFFLALSGRESSLVQPFCESCEQLDITLPSVHMTRRFVIQGCPTLTLSTRSANILAHGLYTRSAIHQYIGAGVFTCVSSEAKRAFGVNPFLLSSNKCRPHLSTYITHREDGRGGASSPLFEKGHQSEAFSST